MLCVSTMDLREKTARRKAAQFTIGTAAQIKLQRRENVHRFISEAGAQFKSHCSLSPTPYRNSSNVLRTASFSKLHAQSGTLERIAVTDSPRFTVPPSADLLELHRNSLTWGWLMRPLNVSLFLCHRHISHLIINLDLGKKRSRVPLITTSVS